jgi:homogentisate 1,2-dioxygenase
LKKITPFGVCWKPWTALANLQATRTEELAVMFDTQDSLELAAEALACDDPAYPLSWLG